MSKLEINTKKNIIKMPINVNGNDYELEIDTQNIEVTNTLINMSADSVEIYKKLKEAVDTKDLEVIRKASNEALETSDRFYNDFCKIFPVFQKATNGVIVRDFQIWHSILIAISDKIVQAKEKESKQNVKATIEAEKNDAIEG